MRFVRRLAMLMVVALATFGFGSTAAQAAYPPGGPILTLSGSTVHLGVTFTIKGAGFKANAKVTLTIESAPLVLGTPTSDSTGAFTIPAKLPCTFPIGKHVITGDDGSGSASTNITLLPCASVNPASPPSSSNGSSHGTSGSGNGVSGSTTEATQSGGSGALSSTGVVILWLLVLAVLALAIGAALVQRSRRRHAQ